MLPRILLINPPIYDFSAYDFWLKPYGMLTVAGFLRDKANFVLFDYLDRQHEFMSKQPELKNDEWGRGRFFEEKIPGPPCLYNIPRHFRRFGLPRYMFRDFLKRNEPFDFVLVSTTMTYWYPGIREVIEDLRRLQPKAKIILGGNYVTLCPEHANKSGSDLIVTDTELEPLWKYLALEPDMSQPALWEAYSKLRTGILKLSDGCPFNCTYCSVPKVYGKFRPRPMERCISELQLLVKLGVGNIAFYDDALLYDSENVLMPFLNEVIRREIKVNFHTPNALNARFLTEQVAETMVQAGVKSFYLGFESSSMKWQKKTGSKVFAADLNKAVHFLKKAGAEGENITAYQIIGHPFSDIQELEESLVFVNRLGIRGMLADFSPIPGTPDGDICKKWVNMDEPLMHNKTAFTIIRLGFNESNRLKELQRELNRNIPYAI